MIVQPENSESSGGTEAKSRDKENGLSWFSHTDCGDGIFAIRAPMGTRIYLVLGTESALVVDTGMGIGPLRIYLETLTGLPLTVVNTHGHPDHAGGNGEFSHAWLCQGDEGILEHSCSEDFRAFNIRSVHSRGAEAYVNALVPFNRNVRRAADGQVFDLGDRTLTLITTPGHTFGSACLYDSLTGALFSGDTVSNAATWLQLVHSAPISRYLRSLRRLAAPELAISRIFPGHPPTPIGTDVLYGKIRCAEMILSGGGTGTPDTTIPMGGIRFEFDGASIICPADGKTPPMGRPPLGRQH
jgi:glyoxylase-like metal-dependent hydrolase (beta-lactamase superfamily II)